MKKGVFIVKIILISTIISACMMAFYALYYINAESLVIVLICLLAFVFFMCLVGVVLNYFKDKFSRKTAVIVFLLIFAIVFLIQLIGLKAVL